MSTTERWYAHEIEAMEDEAGERMQAQMDERSSRPANSPSRGSGPNPHS